MTADTSEPASTAEVAEVADVSFRQLDYWASKGYLLPEGQGEGSGSNRSWPETELRIAILMRRLLDAGLTLSAAADVARMAVDVPGNITTHQAMDGTLTEYLPLRSGIVIGIVRERS